MYRDGVEETMTASPPPGHFRLLYFASAASYTKKSSDDIPAPLPIDALFEILEKKYKGITYSVLSSSAVTVNLDYVDMEQDLKESGKGLEIQAGDEVAIIPPVSSG